MNDEIPFSPEVQQALTTAGPKSEYKDRPFATDETPFAKWLAQQVPRKDRVGALARVAMQDHNWPGGESRAKVAYYFRSMNARAFVMATIRAAWDEFEKDQRRQRTRGKNKAAKVARKKTRAVAKRRR